MYPKQGRSKSRERGKRRKGKRKREGKQIKRRNSCCLWRSGKSHIFFSIANTVVAKEGEEKRMRREDEGVKKEMKKKKRKCEK